MAETGSGLVLLFSSTVRASLRALPRVMVIPAASIVILNQAWRQGKIVETLCPTAPTL